MFITRWVMWGTSGHVKVAVCVPLFIGFKSKNNVNSASCYDHATPCGGNTQLFSKEQMRGSISALRGSTQGRSIIKQVPDKCQSDSLLRQQNNKSLRQAQTLREWEVRGLREGRVQSENHQTPMTADRHHAVEKAADWESTVETHTQTTTMCPKAVESRLQGTTTQLTGRQSCPQYTMTQPIQWKSHPQ
jgi:hypothetical protein